MTNIKTIAEDIVESCWGTGDEGGSEFYHYDLADKIVAALNAERERVIYAVRDVAGIETALKVQLATAPER